MTRDIRILKDVIHDKDNLSERDYKAIENMVNIVEELDILVKNKKKDIENQVWKTTKREVVINFLDDLIEILEEIQ